MDWFWKSGWLICKSALCTRIVLLPVRSQNGLKVTQKLIKITNISISTKNRISTLVYCRALLQKMPCKDKASYASYNMTSIRKQVFVLRRIIWWYECCCSVLQRVAVRRSVLQCVAVCWNVLQCVAVCVDLWAVDLYKSFTTWHQLHYMAGPFVVQKSPICVGLFNKTGFFLKSHKDTAKTTDLCVCVWVCLDLI